MQNELKIERIFDAPVDKVWKYFSDPKLYKKWWGPEGFSAPVIKIDFRVGGKFLGAMHGPKDSEFDKDLWSSGTYKEIVPHKKIVVTDSFADEKGNIVPSSYYGMEDFPLEMLVTLEFEDLGNKTKLTLTHSGIENISDKDREGMDQGWNSSLNKLARLVEPPAKRAASLKH